MTIDALAKQLTLGGVLDELRRLVGTYELLDHWQQGEFHHDTLFRVDASRAGLAGPVLLVATNCNGGVKELLVLAEMPDRSGLWHERCPTSSEFSGPRPAVLDRRSTTHWFDPCELLKPDARSEYRPEFRERQVGGGWTSRAPTCRVDGDRDSTSPKSAS